MEKSHLGKKKVFISFRMITADSQIVEVVKKELTDAGFFVYVASDHKEYDFLINQKISSQLDTSDFLLAIITKDSIISQSVNQEIGFAVRAGIPVILFVEESVRKKVEEEGIFINGKEHESFTKKSIKEDLEPIIEYIKNKEINQQTRKINNKHYSLSRLRIDVNQIIHYLQRMDDMISEPGKYSENEILSCLWNAYAQISDINDIRKHPNSEIDPSLSNTLEKRCNGLQLYFKTYKMGELGPERVGLIKMFENSFMEISSAYISF